jgi:dipeptidyl aminopeptidase/acylaminoacyl peptidase
VVVVDARATDGKPKRLTQLCEKALGEIPMGTVERITSKSADGRSVDSFLVRAADARPGEKRPLVLWVHGGPIGAWSDHWHWRWNPQLFAARGWHVLLPNPRISLGYGQDFVEEGFARWGAEPYQDLMSAVDAAAQRPDVDASRTAAMGGSFGGYMANWINGQTTRFKAIVTHASLYHLSAFHGTTDCGPEWEREFGNPYLEPQAYERFSPHAFLSKMKTPTLIIHGEKDYRVPVSEAYMLFTGLQRHGVPSKLLYFPDENHWILKPPNSRVWHETIFEWLDRWL